MQKQKYLKIFLCQTWKVSDSLNFIIKKKCIKLIKQLYWYPKFTKAKNIFSVSLQSQMLDYNRLQYKNKGELLWKQFFFTKIEYLVLHTAVLHYILYLYRDDSLNSYICLKNQKSVVNYHPAYYKRVYKVERFKRLRKCLPLDYHTGNSWPKQ